MSRQTLVDYVAYHGDGMAQGLENAARYLTDRQYQFMDMIGHARGLRGTSPLREYDQDRISGLVVKLTEEQVGLVTDYMLALGAYMTTGKTFEHADRAADKLIDSLPIPDALKIPDDSLFKTTNLGLLRELV